jgi:molybdopterin/thiamine biosynthesis adenylyltransferase/rhodanese-related sulfurtransferase
MPIGRPTAELPDLAQEEILRYSRHLIIPDVGVEGQRRLKDARVLMVGAGGLGSPIGLYLAAAGVGHLGIVEFDTVDVTNLQRQVLHGTKDVGRKKVDSARDRLNDVNPYVEVVPHETRLTSENALDLVSRYDLVVDGTDNFQTRYLVNDACVLLGKPNVYGSIYRFDGQATIFCTSDGPCYRCLYPEPPPPGLVPSCAEGGVLGVLPGLVGLIQATEAVKLIVGAGEPLVGRLLLVDALHMQFRTLKVRKDPRCPACGTREITRLVDYDQLCGVRAAADETPRPVPVIEPAELAARLRRGDDFDLVDVREPHEWDIARIEGAQLKPLSSFSEAIATLDSSRDVVVYCKSGGRSAKAVRQLQAAGFRRVWNLAGGILRWSEEIDPSVPRY